MLSHSRRSSHTISNSGFTLVELLVGIAVGGILLLALTVSWSLVVRDQVYVLSVTTLNNDMRSLMQIVTQDVRRAVAEIQDRDEDAAPPVFRLLEVGSTQVGGPLDCVAFNAHIGDENVGPEEELRFVWAGTEGPTLIPSGYRLRNGAFEVWAPPPVAANSTTLPVVGGAALTVPQYQSFGKCALPTPDPPAGGNWWTPLIVSGDRGVFLDGFVISTDGSRCLGTTDVDFESEDIWGGDVLRRCDASDRFKVELLVLEFALNGRIQFSNVAREFVFADAVKVRNDGVIE